MVVDSEYSSVVKNKVLTFVNSIPTGKRAIPTKLILQEKLGSGGETVRYKSRLPLGVLGGPRVVLPNCSLYGLTQSPRCWYTTIDEFLVSQLGFRRGRFDYSIYTHSNGTILALYVDNLLLADREPIVSDLQKKLKARFNMFDLGLVKHSLGSVVSHNVRGQKIHITQEGYIGRMLERFSMSNFKPVVTPMDKNMPHEKVEGEEACDKMLYKQLIGSLG